jgi:hypothetical protein
MSSCQGHFRERAVIQSLMQDVPLTLNLVRERVERLHYVARRAADVILQMTIVLN